MKLIKSDIRLTSTQDVGTTFTISFPIDHHKVQFKIDTDSRLVDRIDPEAPIDQALKKRLLVVEDDPNSQKLAELILRKDFDLHFADSVYGAKQILDKHDIHLILLDLSLKGNEDGLDLARFVRNESNQKLLPIIALTAHAFTTDREKCFEVGCNEFLTKPFRRTDLMDLIQKLT